MCTSPVLCAQNGLGPVRLMTIAHAFNHRMAVLRDGVRSAVRVGKMFLDRCEYFMGTTSGSDVPNRIDFDGGST